MQQMRDLARRVGRVDAGGDAPGAGDAEIRLDPVRAGFRQHGRDVAGTKAERL